MNLTRTLSCLAATSALCGCAAMPPQYMLIEGRNVVLSCQDGFMTYANEKTRRILVVPYLASQAEYALCAGNGRRPLSERARQAAQKQVGPTCRIEAISEPLPLNYEFAYVCGAPAAAAASRTAGAPTAAPAPTPPPPTPLPAPTAAPAPATDLNPAPVLRPSQ